MYLETCFHSKLHYLLMDSEVKRHTEYSCIVKSVQNMMDNNKSRFLTLLESTPCLHIQRNKYESVNHKLNIFSFPAFLNSNYLICQCLTSNCAAQAEFCCSLTHSLINTGFNLRLPNYFLTTLCVHFSEGGRCSLRFNM